MKIGERLKKIRKEYRCKVSGETIAKYLGISRQAYNYYENDKYEPSLEILNKLATFYGYSTDYIMGRTENKDGIILSPEDAKKLINPNINVKCIELSRQLLEKGLTEEQIDMLLKNLN